MASLSRPPWLLRDCPFDDHEGLGDDFAHVPNPCGVLCHVGVALPLQGDELIERSPREAACLQLFAVPLTDALEFRQVLSALRQGVATGLLSVEAGIARRDRRQVAVHLNVGQTGLHEVTEHVCDEYRVIDAEHARPDTHTEGTRELEVEHIDPIVVLPQIAAVVVREIARATETDDRRNGAPSSCNSNRFAQDLRGVIEHSQEVLAGDGVEVLVGKRKCVGVTLNQLDPVAEPVLSHEGSPFPQRFDVWIEARQRQPFDAPGEGP